MEHFAIAEVWPVDPMAVKYEWDPEDVLDALQVIGAKVRHQQRHHPKGT
jgi:hypothetical protein